MAGVIQKMVMSPTVPIINIKKLINTNTTAQVTRALQKVNPNTAKGLGVVIDSHGGSINQAQIIGEKLRIFCDKHHLPLYTFAGETVFCTANYLLAIGDRVYADEQSLVGCVGLLRSQNSLKKFIEHQKIENRNFSTHDKLLEKILSQYNSISADETKYFAEILQKQNEKLVEHIKQLRGEKLQSDFQLISDDVFLGEEAQQKGLVDELKDFQQVYYEKFPKANLDFVQNKVGFQDILKSFNKTSFDISIFDKANAQQNNQALNSISNSAQTRGINQFL